MTDWRVARSLVPTLLNQINLAFPGRSKTDDGTIGDTAHAGRVSDHNPDKNHVVTAMDITNDPSHGLVARHIAESLVASKDPRIEYLISNRQIVFSTPYKGHKAWEWQPYTGANAHDRHFHISVLDKPEVYDQTTMWKFDTTKLTTAVKPATPAPVKPAVPAAVKPPVPVADKPLTPVPSAILPIIPKGAKGDIVAQMQRLLNRRGYRLIVDGIYEDDTEQALLKFQLASGLIADGVCGPLTWAALNHEVQV